jgi:sulfite reductase beta subunit-like hemoprotein
MKRAFAPIFLTPPEHWSKEEWNKLKSANAFEGNLHSELRSLDPDIRWEAEQIAKAHGIYLEFDRSRPGDKKDWIYMVRVTIPGGGPLSTEQWLLLDELSERYGRDRQGQASLRLTTRQNIQFHWVRKEGLVDLIRALSSGQLKTLNGAGDNTRNATACPLSRYSDLFDANSWARRSSSYFQLPLDPYRRVFELNRDAFRKPAESFLYGPILLNRKFKIAFGSLHQDTETGQVIPDNCTELLTNDIGISPIAPNFAERVQKFQIYIGGGQGQRNGTPTLPTLAQPLGIADESRLLKILDAIVSIHQQWGDRSNRNWARIKYVVLKMGIDWFRRQIRDLFGLELEPPDPSHDCGENILHRGWISLPRNDRWAYGLFVENGRVQDGSLNGNIKTMVRELVRKYDPEIMLGPNQSVVLCNLPSDCREEFEADLRRLKYGTRSGKAFSALRLLSSACVGLDTCSLAYADSERFEPFLIDELEKLGWGELATSIGVSGCERQCSKPSTRAIGLVGSASDMYQLRLLGTEDGRHQGEPIFSQDGKKILLRFIPRASVAPLLNVLLRFYSEKLQKNESLGYCIRRVGVQPLVDHLAADPDFSDLLSNSASSDDYLDAASIKPSPEK